MIIKDHEKLVGLMKYRGIGQREMASRVGWKSHTILGRIMRGQQRSLDPARAAKIAVILDVPIDDLFLPRMSQNSHDKRAVSGRAA